MKLVYRGEQRFEIVDEEARQPAAGEVLLEVIAAGICGSDIHGYIGLNDRRPPGTVMGHEVVGKVAATASDTELLVGDLVALWPIVACMACSLCLIGQPHLCRHRRLFGCTPELPGGFATHMTVPWSNLVRIPKGVPPKWGALIEPLAVGHHAVEVAGKHLGRVAVVGGGPIGIATAIAARRHGARDIVVVEPIANRRQVLVQMGFQATLAEEMPVDLDTVFECVGKSSTVRAAMEASRPGGTVVCVGVAEPSMNIPTVALVIEERRLLGSSAYTLADFAAATESLATVDIALDAMIQAQTDLVGTPDVFAAYATGATSAIKTLVVPRL